MEFSEAGLARHNDAMAQLGLAHADEDVPTTSGRPKSPDVQVEEPEDIGHGGTSDRKLVKGLLCCCVLPQGILIAILVGALVVSQQRIKSFRDPGLLAFDAVIDNDDDASPRRNLHKAYVAQVPGADSGTFFAHVIHLACKPEIASLLAAQEPSAQSIGSSDLVARDMAAIEMRTQVNGSRPAEGALIWRRLAASAEDSAATAWWKESVALQAKALNESSARLEAEGPLMAMAPFEERVQRAGLSLRNCDLSQRFTSAATPIPFSQGRPLVRADQVIIIFRDPSRRAVAALRVREASQEALHQRLTRALP